MRGDGIAETAPKADCQTMAWIVDFGWYECPDTAFVAFHLTPGSCLRRNSVWRQPGTYMTLAVPHKA